VSAARLLAISVLGHEKRNLMAMIQIIQIHAPLHFSNREHSWSLSRVGLQAENPRDVLIRHIGTIFSTLFFYFEATLQFLVIASIYTLLLVAN